MRFGSQPNAVIFDTDIGTDIDDAVALAYLLRQPRCELVGITIASGAQQDRARLASAVCRAAGRRVPIHCGPEPSLLRGVKQPLAEQAEALDDWPHDPEFPPATAVEWMRWQIRERPGEITLLAVGPLTNIGLLFATDPELPDLLAGLVFMGGRYLPGRGRRAAWVENNIVCDPEAAAIVCDRAPTGTLAVGLDVTTLCTLRADEVRHRFETLGGPLAPVAAMAEVWFRQRPQITFHDPLAAVCVFEPQVCEWLTGDVRVDLKSDLAAGLTRFDRSEVGRLRVAAEVDPLGFFDHYFGVF